MLNLLPRLPKEKARDYAIRVLRENIISLALEPGARVSENDLAVEMGLSRTPIREALTELGNYGIINTLPQHGNFIAKIDYRQIEEARFVRLALETAVVREACDLASQSDWDEFAVNLHVQKMYADNGNAQKLLEMDDQFHRSIFVICDKILTYDMMRKLSVHADRVRQLSLATLKDLGVVEDHLEILAALKARDKDRAQAVMIRHLTRYKTEKTFIEQRHRHLMVI
ncbi:MAG: GntR family transcriptional regulator [Planctomycetota bacterium]|jgi:DNA-binding GntR family transcriptional regulator|nr:GntR family transcriptional regulator [Planctomycetota bacterium]